MFEKRIRTHMLYRTAVLTDANEFIVVGVGFLETMSACILTKVGIRCGVISCNICFYFRAHGMMYIYT
jgi:hypothetical protein